MEWSFWGLERGAPSPLDTPLVGSPARLGRPVLCPGWRGLDAEPPHPTCAPELGAVGRGLPSAQFKGVCGASSSKRGRGGWSPPFPQQRDRPCRVRTRSSANFPSEKKNSREPSLKNQKRGKESQMGGLQAPGARDGVRAGWIQGLLCPLPPNGHPNGGGGRREGPRRRERDSHN